MEEGAARQEEVRIGIQEGETTTKLPMEEETNAQTKFNQRYTNFFPALRKISHHLYNLRSNTSTTAFKHPHGRWFNKH